jgi:RHS repeat-associated protein
MTRAAFQRGAWRTAGVGVAAATFVLFTAHASVTSASLGTLDTTVLPNGSYELRLLAEDVNGRLASVSRPIRIDGQAKPGSVDLAFVDMVVPLAGIPIAVIRTYSSRDKSLGDFGHGWKLDVRAGSVTHNRDPADGVAVYTSDEDFSFPCRETFEQKSHFVEVRLSEREHYIFRPVVTNPQPISGACTAEIFYQLVDGTLPGANLQLLGDNAVRATPQEPTRYPEDLAPSTLTYAFHPEQRFAPNRFQLFLPDGRVVELDTTRGITRLWDRNDHVLEIRDDGIFHSSGKAIRIERDLSGVIRAIVDPAQKVLEYQVTEDNDLVGVVDRLGRLTEYEYDSPVAHHLTGIVDPEGKRVAAIDYDDAGRLKQLCDAENHCLGQTYNLTDRTLTTTDATGRQDIVTYDLRGNISTRENALGHTWLYTHNGGNHLTRLEDPVGNVTAWTYDAAGNMLRRVDPHGAADDPEHFTTRYTYNARNQRTSLTVPSGASIHWDYDARGNELRVRDGLGNSAYESTRGPDGEALTDTTRFGTDTHSYDGRPEPYQTLTSTGETWQMHYNDLGNLIRMTDADGTMRFSYDNEGRETYADYGDGNTVRYSYGTGADWTKMETPYGTTERKLTASGRLGGWKTADGEVTFEYDAAGRLRSTLHPDGSHLTQTYDDAGRLESVTDSATGATTTHEYDNAGRVTSTTDALNHTSSTTYDDAGRAETSTDARGKVSRFGYTPTTTTVTDPLLRETTLTTNGYGLPIRVDFPDGTQTETTYLAPSRLEDGDEYPTGQTDEAGRLRSFSYDASGRLESATDLAGIPWAFGEPAENVKTITSPEGQTLRIETGDGARTTRVDYPGGGTATMTYDARKRPAVHTLPDGTALTYGYDARDRETSRIPSGPVTSSAAATSPRTTTYDALGRLATLTTAEGTTTYTYDLAGRLDTLTSPSGSSIDYDYDVLGQVTAVQVRAHASATPETTSYDYGLTGLLDEVTDPLGGTTTYAYDDASRLTHRTLPNGIVTAYTYDLRDRLDTITHRAPGSGGPGTGAVLASVDYDRDLSGEPTRVTREDGSYTVLEYDNALRLEREARYTAASVLTSDTTYTYDLDGNRLAKTKDGVTEDYTVEAGFRLTAVDDGDTVTSLDYDDNGRVIEKAGASSLLLAYDADDRVVEASVDGDATAYGYDGAGHRIRVTDDQGTRSVLEAAPFAGDLASPHLITDGTYAVAFVYGAEGTTPVMRYQAGAPTYYLDDGMGSVIALADGVGAATATIAYDSFGNVVHTTGDANLPSFTAGDFRHHGMWQDTTGLYHYRARTYDPTVGRFTSRDPVDANDYQPESWHPYAWNHGNGWVYSDPSGLVTLKELNVAQYVQNTLQAIPRAAMRRIVDELKDQAFEVVTDQLINTFINAVSAGTLPIPPNVMLDDISGAGREFEELMQDQLCGFLGTLGPKNLLWIEAEIDGTGRARTNGFSCKTKDRKEEVRMRMGWSKPSLPNPDLLLSQYAPRSLQRAFGGRRSFAVGDFKVTGNVKVSDAQFDAIVAHARNYSYAPVALYVSLVPPKQHVQRTAEQKAARDGVHLTFISLAGARPSARR